MPEHMRLVKISKKNRPYNVVRPGGVTVRSLEPTANADGFWHETFAADAEYAVFFSEPGDSATTNDSAIPHKSFTWHKYLRLGNELL